jgi:hypothetical protein
MVPFTMYDTLAPSDFPQMGRGCVRLFQAVHTGPRATGGNFAPPSLVGHAAVVEQVLIGAPTPLASWEAHWQPFMGAHPVHAPVAVKDPATILTAGALAGLVVRQAQISIPQHWPFFSWDSPVTISPWDTYGLVLTGPRPEFSRAVVIIRGHFTPPQEAAP